MTQNEYEKLVKFAKDGGDAPSPAIVINGVEISTQDLAMLAVSMIDQYNLVGAGKSNKNQYSVGNDCAMPDCFVPGSYLDGIHQQFKDEYSAGWPTVQPTFKLDMSGTNWKGQITDVSAKVTNPNFATLASGYNQASAIMPATKAWPEYEEIGRGTYGEQEGYVPPKA